MRRGEIHWAELDAPRGSGPGYRRPVLVVQSDDFSRSRLQTVIVVVLTTNLALADAPGNVLLPARDTGLPKDSVANVSQVLTIDKELLAGRIGAVPKRHMSRLDAGLRLVLSL